MDLSNSANPDTIALVVDLDGTLSRSDTFHEAILRLGRAKPLSLLRLAAALPSGKVAAKRFVADAEIVPAEELVLNEDVTALIEAARAEVAGRDGLLLCPEGAATWAACLQALEGGLIGPEDHAVLFNCATGLKYPLPHAGLALDRHRPIDYGELIRGD